MTAAPLRTVPDLSYFFDHSGHVLNTHMTAALAEIGITPRHQCVLIHAMERELTQIQLAELTDVDKTTMVVTLDDLEEAGLVERRPSSTDRRARIVHVTEEGVRVAQRGQEIVERVHGGVLEALPESHREIFAECLSLLAAGHLSEPAQCQTPVRRARRSRK